MKKIFLSLFIFVSLNSFAADVYVRGHIDNVSTDYASTKSGFVLKMKNSDYQGCNNKYVKFYLSDFSVSSIDINDAKDRLNFARSLALSAMMSNKRVEFILKDESAGTCTGTGWLKVLSD